MHFGQIWQPPTILRVFFSLGWIQGSFWDQNFNFGPRFSKSSAKTNISTQVASTTRNENTEAVYSKNAVTKSCRRESDCGQYASCIIKEGQGRCVALYSAAEQIKITDNQEIRKEQSRLLVKSEQREVFTNTVLVIGAGYVLLSAIAVPIALSSIKGPSSNCKFLCL